MKHPTRTPRWRTRARVAPVLVFLALAAPHVDALAQVRQPRDAPAKPGAGTASVGGVVTTPEESPRGVRRALVTLSGSGITGTVQIVTDDSGRFVFPQLPAGRYTLTAEKPGYVKTYYGSKGVGRGPATPLALVEAQRLEGLSVTLLRGAAIEGTIVDEHGVPLSSAQVSAWQPVFVNGERKLVSPPGPMRWATTDDRGRYRLYGLPPGEYTVRSSGGGSLTAGARLTTAAEIAAALRDPSSTAPAAPPAPQIVRTSGYFPGVPDAALAEFFRLGPGEERTGVDIQSSLVRAARVEGTAIGPSGQPLHNIMVGLADLSTRSLFASLGIVRPGADGRFRMSAMRPGRYLFFGRGTEADINPNPGSVMPLWTATEITVNEQDVLDVVLQFLPGTTVSGRVILQGTQPPPDFSKLRLTLAAVPAIAGAALSLPPLSPQPDGSFTFSGVQPGKYRFTVAGAGRWSLRSAIADGRDALDVPLDVEPGQNVGNVAVTLTDRPAEISGTLFDRLGRPAPEYAIVVFSTDRTHWLTAPRRMSGVVKLGSDGRFTVTGLPPGEYYLTALTDLDPAQLADPVILEQLASASMKITLAEGERKSQDVRVE